MNHVRPRQTVEAKRETHLYLLPKMQKGLYFLELPLLELAQAIQKEMDQNPLLESEEESGDEELALIQPFEKNSSRNGSHSSLDYNTLLENSLAQQSSLFDALMEQAKEHFSDKDLLLAEALIGHIEPTGLLTTPLEEIANLLNYPENALKAILLKIQEFDPPGIAASSLKESLLIQLKRKGEERQLIYSLVEKYYDEIVKGKFIDIAKRVKKKPHEIQELLIKGLTQLRWHPGADFPQGHYGSVSHAILPDLFITLSQNELHVSVNDEKVPHIRFNTDLLKRLSDKMGKELHQFVKEKVSSGKWLLRHLFEREKTLFRIGEKIAEKQKAYLCDPKGQLIPWTMKELAADLSLHESTIVRAIQNKYASTPKGLLPLRSFFTHSLEKSNGEAISVNHIKELVTELIKNEDPRNPLSDESIVHLLKERGFLAARRTIAKYRSSLGISDSLKRRRFSER